MTVRVVKIGGRAQGDPTLGARLAAARAAGPLCIVHGGGDEVSALQRQLGSEPTFRHGRRVTTEGDLAVVRMVLSGTVNKRLVATFAGAGLPAVGLSGEDGGLLTCRTFGDGSYGLVGEPETVAPAVLTALLDAGFVPVVSPVGRFADGTGCNVNGDDAAAAIAAALGATELLYLADVPGVLDDDKRCLPALDEAAMAALVARGTASGGMIAKLESAQRALAGGVARVRVGDLSALADAAAGTTLVRGAPAA